MLSAYHRRGFAFREPFRAYPDSGEAFAAPSPLRYPRIAKRCVHVCMRLKSHGPKVTNAFAPLHIASHQFRRVLPCRPTPALKVYKPRRVPIKFPSFPQSRRNSLGMRSLCLPAHASRIAANKATASAVAENMAQS